MMLVTDIINQLHITLCTVPCNKYEDSQQYYTGPFYFSPHIFCVLMLSTKQTKHSTKYRNTSLAA